MIEIKNLCKSYKEKIVYRNFNLKIKKQAISGIIGPSGSGKTTLLRILAGIETYDSGKIAGLRDETISYVFQEDRLMSWLSVEDNIKYVMGELPPQEQEERLKWSLGLVELSQERSSSVQALSGGMSRRVAIARALVYESSMLFMDEPFKGLDDEMKWKILEKLMKYWQEKKQTVIIVTHDQQLVSRLDDMIKIDNVNEMER